MAATLVLMDFRMPVMDGHEASAESAPWMAARGRRSSPVTPGDGREPPGAEAIGADDFIGKPFREADLFQRFTPHAGVEYVYARTRRPRPDEASSSPDSWPAARQT